MVEETIGPGEGGRQMDTYLEARMPKDGCLRMSWMAVDAMDATDAMDAMDAMDRREGCLEMIDAIDAID